MNKIQFNIQEILNIDQLDLLLQKFIVIAGVSTAVIDLEGTVLLAKGWQDICTKFHRINTETCKRCIESDVSLANKLKEGQKFNMYKCLNGMVDVAVPIYVNKKHIANLFIGQLLLEKPDMEFFKSQARKHEFDEEKYLEALSRVPILSEQEIKQNIDFLLELAIFFGETGLNKLKLQKLTENQEEIIQNRSRDLKESEERWQFALNGVGDGLWDWNLKTNELYFSKKWKTMLGYEPEDFPNGFETWEALIHPEDKQEAVGEFTSYLEGKTSFYQNEQRLRRKDGTYCWILDRGEVVSYDEDGKPLRFIGTHADISVLKKTQEDLKESQMTTVKMMEEANKSRQLAEEANMKLSELMKDLKRSNEELEQFAYVASHDLQEPLRMVASFTSLIEKNYKDKIGEKGNMYIQYATDGAIRMQALINDLLDFSRITTKGNKFEKIDCSVIVGNALVNLKHSIEENKAIITNDELPSIYVDKIQLMRVFQNLISNAIKFQGNNSPIIHIACSKEKENYKFCVSDNGIGIDKKFNEKIFILFQRLNARNEYSGTGIGLSVCKRIINRHKGEIWVESEQGHGSKFYFTIPIKKPKK